VGLTVNFMINIYNFLAENKIEFIEYKHEAVFTAEEAKTKASHVPGQQTKNLFLCDDKKRRFYLITTFDEKRADLKKLSVFLNEKSLRFAPADKLFEFLGITPGSVSPLGLVNDTNKIVKFYLDEDLLKLNEIYVHPNTNTATVCFKITDFKKTIFLTGHEIVPITI
jgi:Ala-tRNA(Pro) deacylase